MTSPSNLNQYAPPSDAAKAVAATPKTQHTRFQKAQPGLSGNWVTKLGGVLQPMPSKLNELSLLKASFLIFELHSIFFAVFVSASQNFRVSAKYCFSFSA